ncbi:MAG TPA: MarR family transcriptional regulator, partial [Paracoccaceae bacterium]|nr:MarR family transcriptional regulator [Paracoccaceae bacterium]
ISQSQLAQKLGIDRSGVVLLVDELERADLIGRNKVPGDRRAYALRATVKGIKVAKEAADAVGAREERLFAALSAEERAVMTDFLKRIEIAGGAIGDDN